MDNIKESKEYKLAKEWEMAVNSFSFNPKRFAAAIPDMHPTVYALIPKNRGNAWAAAIKKRHAPTTIMIFFLTSCSSLFMAIYTEMAPMMATTPAMA